METRKILPITIAAAFIAAGMLGLAFAPATADHQPADRMSAVGSGLEILSTPLTEGAASEEHTVLTGTIRTSSTTDLVLSLTSECALWTDVTTVGNDDSEAMATVKMWIEIDGEPVAVAGDDSNETGKVVFCNRTYQRQTDLFDDEDATIKTYLSSRSANAFNWIVLDVGSGIHDIVVKAQVESEVTGTGEAYGGVGKRTLVVDPVKLANDAVI